MMTQQDNMHTSQDLKPLTIRRQGRSIRVRLQDRYVLLGDLDEIQEAVTRMLEEIEHPEVVVDLGEVAYLPSSGLGMLIALHRRVARRRGRFRLVNVKSDEVRDLLSISRVDEVLEIGSDRATLS